MAIIPHFPPFFTTSMGKVDMIILLNIKLKFQTLML